MTKNRTTKFFLNFSYANPCQNQIFSIITFQKTHLRFVLAKLLGFSMSLKIPDHHHRFSFHLATFDPSGHFELKKLKNFVKNLRFFCNNGENGIGHVLSYTPPPPCMYSTQWWCRDWRMRIIIVVNLVTSAVACTCNEYVSRVLGVPRRSDCNRFDTRMVPFARVFDAIRLHHIRCRVEMVVGHHRWRVVLISREVV